MDGLPHVGAGLCRCFCRLALGVDDKGVVRPLEQVGDDDRRALACACARDRQGMAFGLDADFAPFRASEEQLAAFVRVLCRVSPLSLSI